jgi:2',3'-cyclic-nucleotide 2'-phosphodiesterase (5'-nucleotidase family)
VARRATLINGVRAQAQQPVLVLDAGSTLIGQWLGLQSEGKVVVEAMNLMGYDAMNIGQTDLSKGLEVLQARAQEAEFPFLSANLVWQESGAPVFEPYVILERGGLQVGLIGVTGQDALQGLERMAPGAAMRDPVESVRQALAEIADQVDLVILLSHLGLEEDKALAAQVPGLDVILGGKTRQLMRAPEWVGQTAITQVGYDGEWLGRLDVAREPGKAITATSEILYMRPDVADDPALAEMVTRYKELYPEPTRTVQ